MQLLLLISEVLTGAIISTAACEALSGLQAGRSYSSITSDLAAHSHAHTDNACACVVPSTAPSAHTWVNVVMANQATASAHTWRYRSALQNRGPGGAAPLNEAATARP